MHTRRTAHRAGAEIAGRHTGVDAAAESLQTYVSRLETHIAQLEAEQAALYWMVGHDELTGLANRRLFHMLAPRILEAGAPAAAVVVVDLDKFKPINDTFGHGVGDLVLRAIAGRLASCLAGNLVARLGGDEFAAVLTTEHPRTFAAWCREKIAALRAAITQPMSLAGHTLTVTAAIGVAPACHNAPLSELLHQADLAMYQAKQHGYITRKLDGEAAIDRAGDRSRGELVPAATPPSTDLRSRGDVSAHSFRSGAAVWVNRGGVRRAGVIEGACALAVLVRYRCSEGAGTVVDTFPPDYLSVRTEPDPYLDRTAPPSVVAA